MNRGNSGGIVLIAFLVVLVIAVAAIIVRPGMITRSIGQVTVAKRPHDTFAVSKICAPRRHPTEGGGAGGGGTISTSLFGQPSAPWRLRYWEPLLASARATSRLLPGWRLRVYLDPTLDTDEYCGELKRLDAEVYVMQQSNVGLIGTLWRFLAAAEERPFVSIDADWTIDAEWASMIRRWLDSNKPFFLRKNPFGILIPVTAGRWGARGKLLLDIRARLDAYYDIRRGSDEAFLTREIWPLMQQAGYAGFSDHWHKGATVGTCAFAAALVTALVHTALASSYY